MDFEYDNFHKNLANLKNDYFYKYLKLLFTTILHKKFILTFY